MNLKKVSKWLRILVLLGLLVYVTYEVYMHQVLGGGKAPSVHALCPFGALESLYTLLFMGSFIQKIYSATVVLLILTIALAILFRRSFCGLLCPFGTLQEIFGKIGRKLFKKSFVVPTKIDKPLRYLKYLLLLVTVGMSWHYGTLWMAPYDPYSAYSHISAFSGSIKENPLNIIGFILLAITILGSIIYDRFFCKYLCPVGAFYGIIGKISPTRVERNDKLCTHCKVCNKSCPVNIDIEKATKVTSAECINCNECVLACPKKGALEIKTAKKVIHPIAILAIVVGLFFGTIFIAQVTGNYQMIPSALKEGKTITISELKGYNTIEDAAIVTGLSIQEIYEKMGIPETVSKETQMKDVANFVEGFEFDAAKSKAGGSEVKTNEKGLTTEPNKVGKIDTSGIKGSMTIQVAEESLKLEKKEFYKLFKIPEDVPAQTKMKEIESVSPGYDFEGVKEALK